MAIILIPIQANTHFKCPFAFPFHIWAVADINNLRVIYEPHRDMHLSGSGERSDNLGLNTALGILYCIWHSKINYNNSSLCFFSSSLFCSSNFISTDFDVDFTHANTLGRNTGIKVWPANERLSP